MSELVADAVVADADVTLYYADALTVLRRLPTRSVDCVITDPPYNVGKDYGVGPNGDRREDYVPWLSEILSECSRVTKDGVVFFPGTANIERVPKLLDGTGLTTKRWLAWHRREFAGDKWSGGPAMCWEPVVWTSVAEKPYFRTVFGHWGRDLLIVDSHRVEASQYDHPCPKPLDVARWLVGLFLPDGGTLLDPFAGTGTFLAAARERGASAIGIEISGPWCDEAARRLSQLSLLAEARP